MPELPEVETMVDRLQKYVGGMVGMITPTVGEDPERYHSKMFEPYQQLHGVFRRGKFMVFMLDDCAILAHNAMSGYWDEVNDPWTFDYVEGKRESSEDDIRAMIEISQDGISRFIQFHDARKFGSLKIVSPEQLAMKLSELGPDAIKTTHLYEPTRDITANDLFDICQKARKKTIKEILLDQKKIAGVGNIYAAEALWRARIIPTTQAKDLNAERVFNLHAEIKNVLLDALLNKLDYSKLNVYRRKICPRCDEYITSQEIKGRNTYWCHECQK